MSTPYDPYSGGQQGQQPDPYAAGAGADPYGAAAYGSQPGTYGSQPGAYGSQPDPYGAQPTYGQPAAPQYAQPQITQPAYGQPGYGQPTYAAVTAEDPGQTLGIVALVMAFVFPIAGIILGVLSRNKSREAGLPDNALGKWGLILSIVFIALGVVAIVLYFVFIFVIIGVSASSSTYDALLPLLMR